VLQKQVLITPQITSSALFNGPTLLVGTISGTVYLVSPYPELPSQPIQVSVEYQLANTAVQNLVTLPQQGWVYFGVQNSTGLSYDLSGKTTISLTNN
jgi:hypothetical protein